MNWLLPRIGLILMVGLLGMGHSVAARGDALPFLAPGDARLRHLVELDADEGDIPLATTWPIPTADLPTWERDTLHSLEAPGTGADAGWFVSGAAHPDQLRSFDDTPREKGQAGVQAGWAAGDYSGGVLKFQYAVDPSDGMKYRFDDSYASWRFGNWWVTLGEQQRWWGPGWDGSLILSNNARPMPSVALDRASSAPFQTKWLHWLGPWRFTTYFARAERQNDEWPHPLFWGARLSFRPLRDVTIGVARTAQWCRVGVCSFKTFEDVFLGKDNATVNIGLQDQPGNQELTWDFRWRLGVWPSAIYWQINGETADQLTPLLPRPRQTMDIVGVELWSTTRGAGGWRTFLEWAGTSCGELSTASSDKPNFNCAYNNNEIFWGYYYRNRVIGDSLQGDGRLLTLGALLMGPEDRTLEFRVRKGVLNRGSVSVLNTLAPVSTDIWNVETKLSGQFHGLTCSLGIGGTRLAPQTGGKSTTASAFLQISAPWR